MFSGFKRLVCCYTLTEFQNGENAMPERPVPVSLLAIFLLCFAAAPLHAQDSADTLAPDDSSDQREILDHERLGEELGEEITKVALDRYVRGDFLLCDAYYQVKQALEDQRELREDLCIKARRTSFRLTGEQVTEHFYIKFAQYHSERLASTWFDQIVRFVKHNREDNIDTRWGSTVVERAPLDFPEFGDDTFVFTETFTAGGERRKTGGEIFIHYGNHIIYLSQFTLLTESEPDFSYAESLSEYLVREIPLPSLFERRG